MSKIDSKNISGTVCHRGALREAEFIISNWTSPGAIGIYALSTIHPAYIIDPAALIAAIRQVAGIADANCAEMHRRDVETIKVLRDALQEYAEPASWRESVDAYGMPSGYKDRYESLGDKGYEEAQAALAEADRIESGKGAEG